jgi:hypothetical protein
MINLADANASLDRVSKNLENATNKLFNVDSILLLIALLGLSFLLGRIIALILRRVNLFFSSQADKTNYLPSVERWRRAETVVVISIAIIRTLLFSLALYLWWVIIHPSQQPTAIIGASALFAVIAGGVFGPVLRDLASGSMMMTEHWFGVGDHIKVEPFADMQGVVERVTLRSTRIRGLSGEVIWVNNQNIQAVRVATKGIRTIAIELFVSNLEEGQKLIEETDLRLPTSPLMVVKPLSIQQLTEAGNNMWHITAIGQTAPGREWLLEKYAIEVMQELNSKKSKSILMSEPISRYTDKEAERKFARTVSNARKITTRPSITAQIHEAARRERAERIKKRRESRKK